MKKSPAVNQEPVEALPLENGLTLKIFDTSKQMPGDRWQVSLTARIEIPVDDSLFPSSCPPGADIGMIRDILGPVVLFEQRRERTFIDNLDKDAVFADMLDSFIDGCRIYLSHPDFSRRYVLKRHREEKQKISWNTG